MTGYIIYCMCCFAQWAFGILSGLYYINMTLGKEDKHILASMLLGTVFGLISAAAYGYVHYR